MGSSRSLPWVTSYRTMPPHVDFESGRDDGHCAGYVQPQPVRHLMAVGVLRFRDLIARVILPCPRPKQSAANSRCASDPVPISRMFVCSSQSHYRTQIPKGVWRRLHQDRSNASCTILRFGYSFLRNGWLLMIDNSQPPVSQKAPMRGMRQPAFQNTSAIAGMSGVSRTPY
jgi:hypothetical protein